MRLGWWRTSHLRSILREARIETPKLALDVGVGAGHWTVTLFSAFPEAGTKIIGLDVEDYWIETSRTFVAAHLPRHQFKAELGDACDIGGNSDIYDLVTCQTVLMHLKAPENALREMCRVLRPGGVLLISEPMNQLNMALSSCLMAAGDVNVGRTIWSFWQKYHVVLNRLGHGNHNIAARMPGLLKSIDGLEDVRAYHSDVVSFKGPDQWDFANLLTYLKSNPESREVLATFQDGELSDLEGALEELEVLLTARGEIVANPQQNILFVARKSQ